MFGSRRRLPFLIAITGAAIALVFVLLSGESADERDTAAPRSLAKPAPDRGGRDRPRTKPPKPTRRLTEAQAVERVRRMTWHVSRGSGRGRLVALTFDDGPGPITPALIAELRRLRVPATFFQVADLVHGNPAVARATQQRPFAVGSHTISHPYLDRMPPEAQAREIQGGAEAIQANGGRYPKLFRTPYGHWNEATVDAVRRNRMLAVFWSVSSRDWLISDHRALARRVIRRAHPGAIVLMHDFGGVTREPTLRAVPIIVRALRRKGYRFVTVPRLLRDAPPQRRPPRPPSPYPL